MEWAQELHDALRNDRFRLLCQPIVPTRATDDGPPHYEILLRMTDTDGGDVSPDTFFPVAERYGMAARVDQWVIEHALAQVSAAGPADACWSINLSGHSLASCEVLATIEGALERYRLDPQRLTFEITETSVVQNFNQAMAFIERLHRARLHPRAGRLRHRSEFIQLPQAPEGGRPQARRGVHPRPPRGPAQ
ncbi:MAG: EAL domain-containing protein [Arhodomonas sp.]|nr:EAL domain-containing protein [Arhodomonas sp.]